MQNTSRSSLNRDSSVSSCDQEELSYKEKGLLKFARAMLQGRLFIGTFIEQRHVAHLNSYRTVIVIDKAEADLIKDLSIVRNHLKRYTERWFGYTTPDVLSAPAGHCVWVDLTQEIYGTYWYKIKSIRLKKKEISLRLKIIRPINELEKSPPVKIQNINAKDVVLNNEFSQNLLDFKQTLNNSINTFFSEILTFKNAKDSFIYISILFMTLFTGSIQLIQYLGDFTLRLLEVLSNLIKFATPIIIACINLVEKTIGGLYLLLAMLWRDRNRSTIYQTNYKPLERGDLRTNNFLTLSPRKLEYRSSVKIKRLDEEE